jgi:hypothetical protein
MFEKKKNSESLITKYHTSRRLMSKVKGESLPVFACSPWSVLDVRLQLLIKILKLQSAAGDHIGARGKLVTDI